MATVLSLRAWLAGKRQCCGFVWRCSGRRAFHTAGSQLPYMEVHPEVADAVASGHPVVALETTIVTHGMPYPENLKTALEVEDIVKSQNALPATIGILDGKVHVGLTKQQLTQLANPSRRERTFKVSRRDLAYIISQGHSGGTTVSATMLCAHKAGIPLFVTGGIGGVHREGEKTLDISADLTELGRTPMAVLCAGAKSILDIGRTLEVLETQGVTVATYGPTKDFPSFFTPKSGFQSPFNVTTPSECARLIESSLSLDIGSGVLIAVPIPVESGYHGDEIEQAIQQALAEAKNAGVTGKAVTPFVLQRVNELTGGKSLETNMAMIKNNVKVGSEIAVELSQLRRQGRKVLCRPSRTRVRDESYPSRRNDSTPTRNPPVVIGGSILDFVVKISSPLVKNEGTNPGTMRQSFGGVGRNIAECLARLGARPFIISAVGPDPSGQSITDFLQELGVPLSGVYRSQEMASACYCVLLDHSGEAYCAVGDMEVTQCISPEWVSKFSQELRNAPMVCMDGNIPEETIQYVCEQCWEAGVPVWYEPTCTDKAIKPISAGCHSKLTYVSPNLSELRNMYHALTGESVPTEPTSGVATEQKLRECEEFGRALLSHTPHLLVSLGRDGVVWGRRGEGEREEFLHYPPAAKHLLPVDVVNVSGAGDSFVGGMISGLIRGWDGDVAVKAGLMAAYLSVVSYSAVSDKVTFELFNEQSIREWAPWTASRL